MINALKIEYKNLDGIRMFVITGFYNETDTITVAFREESISNEWLAKTMQSAVNEVIFKLQCREAKYLTDGLIAEIERLNKEINHGKSENITG